MVDIKVANAIRAMKDLGISKERVKPVLKNLLKSCNNNWDLIEDDGYRTLADAIFEAAEEKAKEDAKQNNLQLDLKGLQPKRPFSDLQEDKTSSNKKRAQISSDLGVPNSSVQKVSAASQPNKASDRAGIDKEASRMGSSQMNLNIKKKTNRVLNASFSNQARDRAGVGREASGMGSAQWNNNLKKETERVLDDTKVSKIVSSQRNMIIKKDKNCTEPSGSRSLVVHQPSSDKKENHRKISDITKGTEKWKISLLDDSGKVKPPKFVYIRNNIVYQDAYIRFSLARIADDDCCSKCSGDCLSYSVPCECASNTKGEFAYTSEGILRETFLDDCISMNVDPQQHHYTYCQNCPLERVKDGNMPNSCKGHLVRKFIKECWSKCGCDMDCGNRVVQRGISCKLQVFLTKEGKGWGLRALHDLPKGAFVCEYVGEILTNIELYERNTQRGDNVRHTYPVLLDADWSSERVLEDKDALCLDATKYGNVARFINHRCYDSNLIDIPVEIETPDHHYYHIAFFTKRKVAAFEELTWDYKIDFNDHTHPIEAFHCSCGSEFCRDPKVKEPIQEHQNDRRLMLW